MRYAALLLTPLMIGCTFQAPASAEFYFTTGNVSMSWSSLWNDRGDGMGALLFLDGMVTDSNTDAPLNKIEVEIISYYSGVYLLPQEAVIYVTPPASDGVDVNDPQAVSDACENEDGVYAPEQGTTDWCAYHYNAESGQYFQISSEYLDGGEFDSGYDYYAPTYMIGKTDSRGLIRTYVYIDQLPLSVSGDSFDGVEIGGTIKVSGDTFSIEAK